VTLGNERLILLKSEFFFSSIQVMVPVSSTVMPVDLLEKHRSYDERLKPSINQPKAEFRKSKREKTESFFWPLKLY
jgi:hypothetical protein